MFQLLAQNLLRFGSNLIMTRLLVPDAFALLSLVFVIITAVNLSMDFGIHQSILREKDGDTDSFLRTAWVMKVIRGVFLALLLLCMAGVTGATAPHWTPAGSVYADPSLPGLIALGALVPLLSGFDSTNWELSERRICYKPLALIEITAQITSILSMLLFAQISPTVWALMGGALVAFLVKMIGSHAILPGPDMRWLWQSEQAWRIWHFGKWLIFSSLFTFVGRNADKLIFGALLGITSMGLLAIAYVWIAAAQTVIQQLLSKVAQPVLNEVRRERADQLGQNLARAQWFVDILCVTACLSVVLLGPWLVSTLYTETYHMAGNFMALLGIALLCLRFELLGNLLMVVGDSKGMMWLWAQRAAFLALCLPLVYNLLGLAAALAFTALHSLVTVPFVLYRLRHVIDARVQRDSLFWLVFILALGVIVVRSFPLAL